MKSSLEIVSFLLALGVVRLWLWVIRAENKLAWSLSLLAIGSYFVVVKFVAENWQLPFVIVVGVANMAIAYFVTRKLSITLRRRCIFLAGHGFLSAFSHALIVLGTAFAAMIIFKLSKLT